MSGGGIARRVAFNFNFKCARGEQKVRAVGTRRRQTVARRTQSSELTRESDRIGLGHPAVRSNARVSRLPG